jgi:hypothetical protein
MLSTLLSSDRRGLRFTSLALAGAAMLAACDNDQPLSPTSVPKPSAPSPALAAKGGTLVIAIVDQNTKPVTTLTSQFTVANMSSGLGLFALDNGAGDTDPTVGSIRMTGLASAKYEVCQTVAPTDYLLPATACQTVIVGGIVPAQLTFIDPTVPHAVWTFRDGWNNIIPGGTVIGNDGTGPVVIADNSPLDLDPTPGRFDVKVPLNNGYTICPKTPPAGYVFMSGQYCIGMPTSAGQTTDLLGFGVNPKASAWWYTTDFNVPVGPAEFSVTDASGNVVMKIVDDGQNDSWQALGKFYVTFPAPGDYLVCETTPPPNTMLADPACMKVSITLGVPAYIGLFNSKPI